MNSTILIIMFLLLIISNYKNRNILKTAELFQGILEEERVREKKITLRKLKKREEPFSSHCVARSMLKLHPPSIKNKNEKKNRFRWFNCGAFDGGSR